jgi:hypothetical protein
MVRVETIGGSCRKAGGVDYLSSRLPCPSVFSSFSIRCTATNLPRSARRSIAHMRIRARSGASRAPKDGALSCPWSYFLRSNVAEAEAMLGWVIVTL